MTDLDYEVTCMDEKLATLEEYLPDDRPESTDVAFFDAQNQWKDVKKAAEEAASDIGDKQARIEELEAELADTKQNYADDDEQADKREAVLRETIEKLAVTEQRRAEQLTDAETIIGTQELTIAKLKRQLG